MSDENPLHENQAAAENSAAPAAPKSAMPPMVALAFVIIALLGMLIVMVLRGNIGGSTAGAPEINQLQAEANALRTQLNNERVAMGLRPLEGGGAESVDQIATRLKKDADTMVALASSFQSMLADKDLVIKEKSDEILRLEQLRQSFAAESKRLSDELQRALVNGSETDLLRRDFANSKAKCDALTTELANLRSKGQGVPSEEFADLKRRFDETQRAKDFFEAKVHELEAELAKLRIFANSEDELLPAAVELFRKLRELEGKADSEISTAYSSLGVSLGANVLHTLNFATGSAGLAPEDQEKIRKLVADVPDGDLVLVIGYASITGNVESNRKLSSDRATAAAELFSSVKRPGQMVQAVYLGQTDRFGSRIPERNQIVELWRIRKKN